MEIEREPAKEGGRREGKKKKRRKRTRELVPLCTLRPCAAGNDHVHIRSPRGVSTKSFAGSNAFFTWRIRHAPTRASTKRAFRDISHAKSAIGDPAESPRSHHDARTATNKLTN